MNEIEKLIKQIKLKVGKSSGEKVIVKSAAELDLNTREHIENMFGEYGDIEYKLDENLLGGLIIKIGNKVFDGTIKSKLSELSDTIKSEVQEKLDQNKL